VRVVVSGDLGAGKSTAVSAVMRLLGWTHPAGFFTHWGGAKRGAGVLYLETWRGECRPIAFRRESPAAPGELPYELDAAAFLAAALPACRSVGPRDPVVLDELGLIEWNTPEFVAAVVKLFRGDSPVLAVVQRRALDRWLEAIGRERVDHIAEVKPATRDALPGRLAGCFAGVEMNE